MISYAGKTYIITGIFSCKSGGSSSESLLICNADYANKDECLMDVYVVLKDRASKNYYSMFNSIKSDLHKINSECEASVNEPLLYEKGINEDGQSENANNNSINLIILGVCVSVIIIITVYNTINICLSKWISIISVYKNVGVTIVSVLESGIVFLRK